jgi:hypothetical protein
VSMLCRLGAVVVIAGAALAAQAETLAHLQERWRAINTPPLAKEKFEQLIPQLLAYRQQVGGKSWQLNYMLGSSYCVSGQTEKGKIALYRALASYGLSDTARDAAVTVIADCGRKSDSVQEPSFIFVPVSGQQGARVLGKGGYVLSQETTTGELRSSPVSLAELQNRVFAPGHSVEAVTAALKRDDNPKREGAAIDGFVVVSSRELPPKDTGECLARYRRPLEAQFGMQSPDALITVYNVRTPEDVRKYAERLHGVDLPLGTVAYSVYEDLSIVGIADFNACGSMAHELVHLSIRQTFGDSPAWLEEGLASEVAVATPEQSTFRFNSSWRDDMLRRQWGQRPSVSQLLRKTWADYATSDVSQVDRIAALHAMSASFVRYLDARQKLVPIYFAMRESLSSPDPRSDEEILKLHLGMSLDDIDADFVKWIEEPDKPSTSSLLDAMPAPRSLMECDDSLWNHVPVPQFLSVKDKCIAVTGTIVDATNGRDKDGLRREPTGNARGWLKLDTKFQDLLNEENLGREDGNLVFQIVCERFPMTQSDANPGCVSYQNTIKIPPIGSHVRVVGVYVQRASHGAWMEIHPVTSITVIP